MQQSVLMPDAVETAPTTITTGLAEFTVSKHDLLAELNGLQRVAARKTTIAILNNLHIQAAGNALFLTASDADLSLRTVCPARIKKEGRLTVPAHKLYDYVRCLEDGDITMRLQDNHWIQVRSGRSHTKIVGMAPDSFPSLPLFPAASAIKVDSHALQYLITRTSFAVSVEESRYILNAALLLLKPDSMTMVSTDGNRLACAEYLKPQATTKELRILLSKKTIAELCTLLSASKATQIQFAQDDSTLYFAVGSRLLSSRQVMGRFPSYEAVLPKDLPHKTVVSRGDLLTALQRVAQFSDVKWNGVKVRLAKKEFKLASSNPECGESEDILPATYSGEQQAIAFNSEYLLDFLRVLDCENVCLQFKDAHTASELRPDESDNKDFTYRYVVMPLKM